MDKEEHVAYFGNIRTLQTYYKCPICQVYYNVMEYFIEMKNGESSYTCPLEHKTKE